MKNTTLSLAISLALWGGVPAVYADVPPLPQEEQGDQQPPPPPSGQDQQRPQSGSDGQPTPQPISDGQQPPNQPSGDGQQPPNQPGDDSQQRPYQPGDDDGQPTPYQPGDDGQLPPYQPGDDDGQPTPYQPGDDGQPTPYQPGDDGQQPPYELGDDGQQPPYELGDDGQPTPYQPGDDGQQPPYELGDDGQQPPYELGDDGQQPPYELGGDGQQPPYELGDDGQPTPYQPGDDGQQRPYQPGDDDGQQPPYELGGDGQPMPQPGGDGQHPSTCDAQQDLEELGIIPQYIEGFEQLKPEEIRAFCPKHLKEVPPHAFNNMGPEQLKEMPQQALEGMTLEQFKQLPPESLEGLEAHNMHGLPPEVIREFEPTHLSRLNKEQFQSMPNRGIAKMMVNLDPDKNQPDDVRPLLREDGLGLEDDGTLNPPPGAELDFPPKQPQSMPSRGELPEIPDFSNCFCIGGRVPPGKKTVLEGLNQGLAQAGYSQLNFKQRDEDSILNVEGSIQGRGLKGAFIPDVNNMIQADENARPGMSKDEDSDQFAITTPNGHKIPVIPAPNSSECVSKIVGEDGSFEMGERGDVLLKRPGEKRHTIVVMFNPFVAQSEMSPGLHFMNTRKGQEEPMMVCDDGTMQPMRPTVLSPDKFIERGLKFDGVEQITHRMDGTFKVKFKGQDLNLEPTLDVEVEPLTEGKQIEPDIDLKQDGTLEYTVPNEMNLLRFKLRIRQ
jgi:hypothetical protein